MPILWRYLAQNFLRVFGLCLGAFLAILLTSRLEEIAHFSSLGADLRMIGLFTLFQIPYILPIAIPVSCLIASILLMKRLSSDQELVALRSSGFSLNKIIAPLLLLGAFISLFNFYTVSELATLSHLKANFLKNELRSVNPLLLFHNKPLMQMKGIYYDARGGSKLGQSAKNVIIAMPDEKRHSLNLFLAKEMSANDQDFSAQSLSILSPIKSSSEDGYSDLILETLQHTKAPLENFSELIQKKTYSINNDTLNMGFLLLRLQDGGEKRQIYSEIARRISAGLAPFTFTLLGLCFGMSISRLKNKYSLAFPMGLAALYLTCFFAGKAFESQTILAYSLYLLPHFIIIAASIYKIENISKGNA
jgi:lipopolysaccharide export system permease protein